MTSSWWEAAPPARPLPHELAAHGRRVLLIDREGRIKPCGGAIPTRLIDDFAIPAHLITARIRSARIVAPSSASADMKIDKGFVGMVDRDTFDAWLRDRARDGGRRVSCAATFLGMDRRDDGLVSLAFRRAGRQGGRGARHHPPRHRCRRRQLRRPPRRLRPRGQAALRLRLSRDRPLARAAAARLPARPLRRLLPGRHLAGLLRLGLSAWRDHQRRRRQRPKGFDLKDATALLREAAGLDGAETVRREGAPLPLKPLARWDNGRDTLLAGDSAGVVAPASGEGIYYAMLCGRLACEAVEAFFATGDVRSLKLARKRFMREHGRVFWILGAMQWFWYASDKRRERFTAICGDADVQRIVWESYLNKRIVWKDPLAHVRVVLKDLRDLVRLAFS